MKMEVGETNKMYALSDMYHYCFGYIRLGTVMA